MVRLYICFHFLSGRLHILKTIGELGSFDGIVNQRAILYNTHVLLMNSLDVNHVQKKKEVSSTPSDCRGGIKMGRERKKYCESCVQSQVSKSIHERKGFFKNFYSGERT